MEIWIHAVRGAAAANLLLLVALGSVWLRGYRQHGARHTLGLLVFAGFLLVENVLWLYFYVFHSSFVGWFGSVGTDVQIGITLLCGLELLALLVLTRITWA
ncbi:hypothetical protein [Halostella sp. PRR32]|uniref:hypothetical protein n=1 Tax=Halostella sp. PRR32 TaxID=3098147 RepID=UPI002B1DFF9D|nr:hypothetical protein [Halostella sp. PRR32]